MARVLKAVLTVPVLAASTLLPLGTVYAGGPSSFCDDTGTPVAGFTASPGMNGVGSLTITFDGAADTEACSGTITSYSWDLGDGTTATGATVTHTYGIGTWHPMLTVTNSAGLTDTSSATAAPVVVKASNTAPVLGDDSATVLEGSQVTVNAAANDTDPDGDPLLWQVATQPTHGYIAFSDAKGNFTYSTPNSYSGPDSFTYTVDDGFGGVSTATVNITVTPLIAAQDDTATTPQTSAVTIPVLANDSTVNGDPLTVTSAFVSSGFGTVSVSSDGQSIVFTPNSAWSGTADLYYYAAVVNEPWLTARADVTVTVTKVDQAPVAYDASFSTSENTPLSSNVRGYMYDPDGDTLTTSALTQPAHGTLAFTSDGSFTYTPDNNYYGVDSFTYQTADPSGATAQATVTLNVRFVDQPPVAQQDNVTTDEGTPVTFNVLANDSDPDGDPLHVTGIVTAPDRGTAVVNSDGTITYTPTGNLAGTDVLVYQIADPTGDTSNAFVVVTVNPVNDAPTASFTWTAGSHHSANFSATASDVDGSALSYAWDFGDGSTGSGSNAQHRYKRGGTYVVTLMVTDDQGTQTTVQKTITI